MKKSHICLVVSAFLLIMASLILPSCGSNVPPKPPVTKIETVTDTLHNIIIEDHYRWLEDQESAETRTWIKEQNDYTQAVLAKYQGKELLKERFAQLIKNDYISRPYEYGGRFFLYKKAADEELYSIYMRDSLDGEDKLLLDPHILSEDLTTSVGLIDVSKDGTILIYSIREGGEDETKIKLMNVDTGEEFPDSLPRADYFSVSIMANNAGCFYSYRVENGCLIKYHKMGTPIEKDVEIFGRGYGPEYIISSEISEDGKYLLIYVYKGSSGEKTEIYYKDLTKSSKIKTLVNDIDAVFEVQLAGDDMFINSNWNAPNWKIMKGNMSRPSPKNWKELIPESKAVIKGFSAVGGKLFVNFLENVKSKVIVYDTNGNGAGSISFPSIGSISGMSGRWDSKYAFFSYTSFHIPTTIYQYRVAGGTPKIWHQDKVPVDTDKFDVSQIWFESKDGTKVPMFLVHLKDIKLDGNNPTLLTSYGGFRSIQSPYFSSMAVNWVENGGVYALPNIRGGGEFGEEWHRAAMFEKKQNSFDDFYAAAEWLIKNKYTNPSKLAIRGGSNGGLLVGAAMTQRPELFGAVVCTYPLLDMLRYHKFLMGPYWISEYGCADSSSDFDYIYAYSPYQHVTKGEKYPAVMFITGDGDTRVDPMHARKMTALMQASTGSDRPILLLYDDKAGHSGGKPISKYVDDLADEQLFLFNQLGMKVNQPPKVE